MDIITQGLAGAMLAQAGAKTEHKRIATVVGFSVGLLPDADILIRSSSDPLLNLEYHRQFSHALLFIPAGALIAAILLLPVIRRHLSFFQLYIFCLLSYSTGGLLDACTSFGTQLFWPFSDQRIAWNLIAVIDPVFTLGLSGLLIIGWKKRKTRFAVMGVGFAVMYLLLAFAQQQTVAAIQQQLAQARGHQIEQSIVKPTLGNIILWRSVYLHQGYYYVDGIRDSFFGQRKIYTGNAIEKYRLDSRFNDRAIAAIQYDDLKRFNSLSLGFLVKHPKDSQVIGDIRYAMLPHITEPLWGIRMDRDKPQEHVREVLFRKSDSTTRKTFLRMLLGENIRG